MISPAAAFGYFGWRVLAGVQAIEGKHSAPATIELTPAQLADQAPAFARACREFELLGFTPVGDFEVRAGIGPNTRQRTVLRSFLAPDRSAFAVVYELVSLTVRRGVQAGAQKIWAELSSRRSESESITTSSGEPPLSLLDPNPKRPVHRFPGAAPAALWEKHRALAGMSLEEVPADQFATRFAQAWTRSFEFQESRGLYRRKGDRFVATRKLAVRSVLEFHLRARHRKGPAYALLVFVAVAGGAAAAALIDPLRLPALGAAAGVAFALLFRHFELPGVLFIAALGLSLGRDDPRAILAFLFTLVFGAVLLLRWRAAKAAARFSA